MTVTAAPPRSHRGEPGTPDGSSAGASALTEVQSAAGVLARLRVLTVEAGSWTPEVRREVLTGLGRVVDGLITTRAAVLVAEQRSGAWQGSGDRSFSGWHARNSGSGDRSAAAQVRQAERLAAVPQVAHAVADGRILLEHAEVIAGLATTGTPAQREAVSSPDAQEQLIAMAGEVDAGAFSGAVSRWAASVAPDALEAEHQAQRRERFLHVTDTPRGAFLRGRLDQAAGRRLAHALEALTPRPAVDDDRDAGQRAADALDAMALAILASADTKPGAHVPPQVSLIMTEATWVAARAHRDRQRAAADGAGAAGGADGASAAQGGATANPDDAYATSAPATWEDGTPVPISELAIALCECDVTRIAVDATGVPVDLGRTHRLFTGEQRRAIIARDRECIWPSCHQPARWCQIHHLRWWERDAGPTSLDNGGLVCTFHHQEIHRRDLIVTRHVGPRSDGSPPWTGPPDVPGRPQTSSRRRRRELLAAATYEFRDRAGRILGEPPPGVHRAANNSAVDSPAPAGPGATKSAGDADVRPGSDVGGADLTLFDAGPADVALPGPPSAPMTGTS